MIRRWHVIADLVKLHGLASGAEVGVAEGRFSAALLDLCPHITLWAIDNYLPGYKTWHGTEWTQAQQDANKSAFCEVLARFPSRLRFMRLSSLEAANRLPDASLDFVFIDADHSYAAVKADIEAWKSKIRTSGWITGHDYNKEIFPGVVQAVDEVFPDAIIGDDHVWMVQV